MLSANRLQSWPPTQAPSWLIGMLMLSCIELKVTSSNALVTSSDALVPSSFLFLVVRPGATSGVLAPGSDALVTSLVLESRKEFY